MNNDFRKVIKPKLGTIKKVLLIILALLLGCLGFGMYCFSRLNNPISLYHNLIDDGVDTYLSMLVDEKIDEGKRELGVDFNLIAKDDILDKKIVDFINKTSLKFTKEYDIRNNKFKLILDADYDKENLINANMILEKDKTYIYLPEYLDKYIQLNNSEVVSSDRVNLVGEMSVNYLVNKEKAGEILKKELRELIKEDECQKEKDNYIFRISDTELIKRLKLVLLNLKENQEFLNCYSNAKLIKEKIENLLSSIDKIEVNAELISVTINKKQFASTFNELKISSTNKEIIYVYEDDKIKFNFSKDGISIDGYLKVLEKSDKHKKFEISINSNALGKIIINFDLNVGNNSNIESIDQSKITTADAITEAEMMEIMQKLQNSKLYSLISELVKSTLGNTDLESNLNTNNITVPSNQV